MTAPKPVGVTAADLGVAALERLVARFRADADTNERAAAAATTPEISALSEGAMDAYTQAAELANAERRALHRQLAGLRNLQTTQEPSTDDQAQALTEHLVNGHHIAPTGLDDLEGDTDDHQPVQDRAEELARQRLGETAEATS